MKFKNICFILISLIILITLTSVVYANDDNATNNNNLIKSQIEINQMENIDEIKILENKNNARKDNIDQNTILNLNETQRNNLDYIVTNQTFHDYFDEKGLLKEDVASGATLDFQGKFIANENESFIMNITKPINIISTTHDAYIDMNTTAQGKNAEIPGNHITICREGFSTNITGITFHNSQIYLNNTSYITLNNISVIVENQRIGYSVISIFDNSTHITIKDNYFFTKNFYGTYTLFLNMTNNCIIHNNTFELDDNADSPIYLYYDSEVYDSSNYNFNNNITNNKFGCGWCLWQ